MAASSQNDLRALTALFLAGGMDDAAAEASAMLAEAGSIGRVLSRAVAGRMNGHTHGASILAASSSILTLTLKSRIDDRPILPSHREVIDYLQFTMGHLDEEELRVLFLDTRFRLLRDEVVAQGTMESVNFDIRRILRRALELNASALIVAHNHPSGSIEPSDQDRRATRLLCEGAKAMRIEVLDHLILGQGAFASLRNLSMM